LPDEQAQACEHDHAVIAPAHKLARYGHAALYGLGLGRQYVDVETGGPEVGAAEEIAVKNDLVRRLDDNCAVT
jgi:hypothetical protein